MQAQLVEASVEVSVSSVLLKPYEEAGRQGIKPCVTVCFCSSPSGRCCAARLHHEAFSPAATSHSVRSYARLTTSWKQGEMCLRTLSARPLRGASSERYCTLALNCSVRNSSCTLARRVGSLRHRGQASCTPQARALCVIGVVDPLHRLANRCPRPTAACSPASLAPCIACRPAPAS